MGQGGENKRVRRAREQIDKALARQDLELAVDAVMNLDKVTRQPFLTLVSPWFRRELPVLQKACAWARLHTLAARAEQEPRLLTQAADDAALAAARWPLFLACMRARDFARAGRYWQSLAGYVASFAPGLARALSAWIDGQGQIDSSCLAELDLDGMPGLAAVDQSLATQVAPRPRPALLAAPTSLAQVEDALCSLFSSQPLSIVSDTLRAWLLCAPAELAKALRTQAGSLATRELLLRASSGTSLAEAGRALARMAEGAADDLAEGLLLATRLFITSVATKKSRPGEAEVLEALVAALVRTTGLEGVADILAHDLAGLPGLAFLALHICQGVLSRAETLPGQRLFAVWAQALDLSAPPDDVDDEDLHNSPGPAWLQAATRVVCRRGKTLAAYLDEIEPAARENLLADLVLGQPCELVVDLIDAVWNDASEDTRRVFAAAIPTLIMVAENASMDRLAASRSIDQLASIERIASAAAAADPDLPFLGAGGLVLWRRLGPRVLPYHVGLLPFALFQARHPDQRIGAVKAYIGDRTDIEAWLEAMRELARGDSATFPPLIDETSRLMIERFRGDRIALARGLVYAARFGVPWRHLRALAHAYQRAAMTTDLAEFAPEDRQASRILVNMFGGQYQAPRKRQTGGGKPAKRRRKPEPQREQLGLPLGEIEP